METVIRPKSVAVTTWVLWGRADCTSGEPIRIMSGTLAQVRAEDRFRSRLQHRRGAFFDLRMRKEGESYDKGTPYRLAQPTEEAAR